MFTKLVLSLQGIPMPCVEAEAGQGLVEYSLILAFVVVVAIAALTLLGSDLSNEISTIATTL